MPATARHAATAFAAFTAALLINQYYRTAMALMAPALADELRLTADRLGILAATYFLSFAVMQLPTGMLLDRFGPRRTAAGLMAFAVLGALVFALAPAYPLLILGQALLGAGTAAGFTGGIVICARWYSARRAATMTGLMLGLGNLGGILAATPLALALESWGWRATTLALAAVLAATALIVLAVVRDAPPGHAVHTRKAETLGQILAGLGQVLRTAEVWRLMALAFVGFASVMAVRGLWGGPYLFDVHTLDAVAAGNILLAMSLGVIAGAIGYGLLEQPLDRRRDIALAGGAILAAAFATLALWPQPPLWLVVACFVAIGACGQTYVMILAHGRANFVDRLVGRAVTTLNMAVFLGTATVQAASGWIVRGFQLADGHIPEQGYRWLYGFLAVTVALALAIYSTSSEARPSEDATRPRIG
jgi:predicted MFS family arabinose efflux permease